MLDIKLHFNVDGFKISGISPYYILKSYRHSGKSRTELIDFATIIVRESINRAFKLIEMHPERVRNHDDQMHNIVNEDIDFVAEYINLVKASDRDKLNTLKQFTVPDKFDRFYTRSK